MTWGRVRVNVGDEATTGDFVVDGDLTVGTSNDQILGPASGSATAGAVSYSFAGDTDTGFFRSDANLFHAATDGATRMTWAADGKVGIGTTTPTSPLHVVGNIAVTGTVDSRDLQVDGDKLDAIDASADVTDAAKVNAAGAVMNTDYNAGTFLYATSDDTPAVKTPAEVLVILGVTSDAAELNILDGVTSTAAELNILDGVTSTAAELNILDGVTSTAAELNILDDVTSTATELNFLDGTGTGTVVASKAVIVDSNKDVSGFRNVTLVASGALTTPTLVLGDTAVTSSATELNFLDGTGTGTVVASKAVIVDNNKDVSGFRNITATTFAGALNGAAPAVQLSGDTLKSTVVTSSLTSVGTLAALTVTGDLAVDTDTLFVDASEDRIGINTASPAYALDVTGTVRSTSDFLCTTSGDTFASITPPTGTGDDAHWVCYSNVEYIVLNGSRRKDKENETTSFGDFTAGMIDQLTVTKYNRKNVAVGDQSPTPGPDEIGLISDDVDLISEYLTNHGTDADGDATLGGINKTGWMSLLTLAVQDIRTRLAALEA